MKQPIIRMLQIPPGKTDQEMLAQYANAKIELGQISTHCRVCACCGESFSATRKPRAEFKMYQTNSTIPVAFVYRICGRCMRQYKRSCEERGSVVAALQKFCTETMDKATIHKAEMSALASYRPTGMAH